MWDPMGDAAKRERANRSKPVSKEAKQLKVALTNRDEWQDLAQRMGEELEKRVASSFVEGRIPGLLEELKKMEAKK